MAKRIFRPIRVDGEVARIPLTRGREAVIDAADAATADLYTWYTIPAGETAYAATTIRDADGVSKRIYLHRHLLSATSGFEVDHRNGDGLDNRRANIRLATQAENRRNKGRSAQNKSGLKGASWNENAGKWEANIRFSGKRQYLGLFETAQLAHEAYAAAAHALHGEFARTS